MTTAVAIQNFIWEQNAHQSTPNSWGMKKTSGRQLYLFLFFFMAQFILVVLPLVALLVDEEEALLFAWPFIALVTLHDGFDLVLECAFAFAFTLDFCFLFSARAFAFILSALGRKVNGGTTSFSTASWIFWSVSLQKAQCNAITYLSQPESGVSWLLRWSKVFQKNTKETRWVWVWLILKAARNDSKDARTIS